MDVLACVVVTFFGAILGVLLAVIIASTIGMIVAPYAPESTVNLVEFPSMGAGAVLGAIAGYVAGRAL